jgi:hypothetical protein
VVIYIPLQLDGVRKLLGDLGKPIFGDTPKVSNHKVTQGKNFEDSDPETRERRNKVEAAMVHAWSSYEKYAWGMDELLVWSSCFQSGYAFLSCLNLFFFPAFHQF